MNIQTFGPSEPWPEGVIRPQQTHSTNLREVKTGKEDLSDCDGIWTRNQTLALGIVTADCAPICFWDEEKFGILHAGWRGLVNGIIEKMNKIFDQKRKVWIGPLLPTFEIQKDGCYDQIHDRFNDQFFSSRSNKLFFNFQGATGSILPDAQFDNRSTFDTPTLASWRRDKQKDQRNLTIITPNPSVLSPPLHT